MKIRLAAWLVVGVLAAWLGSPVRSEESSSALDTVKLWFQHWKEGLAGSAVEGQFQQKSLTAVAAVRGDEQTFDDPNKPYIKGKLSDIQARRVKKERVELGKAVDLILSGKLDDGGKKLDEFETHHPKSTLLSDVQKAREKLKELKSASSK